MKKFSLLLFLLFSLSLSAQENFITTSVAAKQGIFTSAKQYNVVSFINIYDNSIYHIVDNKTYVYLINNRQITHDYIIYTCYRDGKNWQIKKSNNQISFKNVFSNDEVIFYYETY
jgi:hypothetical protein